MLAFEAYLVVAAEMIDSLILQNAMVKVKIFNIFLLDPIDVRCLIPPSVATLLEGFRHAYTNLRSIFDITLLWEDRYVRYSMYSGLRLEKRYSDIYFIIAKYEKVLFLDKMLQNMIGSHLLAFFGDFFVFLLL